MQESDDQEIFGGKSSGDDVKEQSQVKEESAESVKPAEISEDDIFWSYALNLLEKKTQTKIINLKAMVIKQSYRSFFQILLSLRLCIIFLAAF